MVSSMRRRAKTNRHNQYLLYNPLSLKIQTQAHLDIMSMRSLARPGVSPIEQPSLNTDFKFEILVPYFKIQTPTHLGHHVHAVLCQLSCHPRELALFGCECGLKLL